MVNKINIKQQEFFQCEECNYLYKEKVMAKKCEEWCKEHKSCNLDIIKHGMKGE